MAEQQERQQILRTSDRLVKGCGEFEQFALGTPGFVLCFRQWGILMRSATGAA
jgi:hypothetical protein